jgi:hypothetical protein
VKKCIQRTRGREKAWRAQEGQQVELKRISTSSRLNARNSLDQLPRCDTLCFSDLLHPLAQGLVQLLRIREQRGIPRALVPLFLGPLLFVLVAFLELGDSTEEVGMKSIFNGER